MAYCKNCGSELPEGTRFCPSCGAPSESASESSLTSTLSGTASKKRKMAKKPLYRKWWFWLLLVILAGNLVSCVRSCSAPTVKPAEATPAATSTPAATAAPSVEPVPSVTPPAAEEPSVAAVPDSTAADSEIRPEVKEFLDSYEAFMDEYVEFMARYTEAGPEGAMSMLSEYYGILTRYAEFTEKIGAMDEGELNSAELAYYLEVTSRVSQKLLSIAG